MSTTTQRQQALEQANAIRRARARLRHQIVCGEVRLATVLLDPPREAQGWEIGDALMTQRHWGSVKTRTLLSRIGISPLKPIGELTERRREQLARAIS